MTTQTEQWVSMLTPLFRNICLRVRGRSASFTWRPSLLRASHVTWPFFDTICGVRGCSLAKSSEGGVMTVRPSGSVRKRVGEGSPRDVQFSSYLSKIVNVRNLIDDVINIITYHVFILHEFELCWWSSCYHSVYFTVTLWYSFTIFSHHNALTKTQKLSNCHDASLSRKQLHGVDA